MGLCASNLSSAQPIEKLDARIFIMGLSGAGKTTLLFQLKDRRTVQTMPTDGFNVESLEWRHMRFTFWDVGSQMCISNWSRYLVNVAALIYVVDATDVERLDEAAHQLHDMIRRPQLKNALLLVLVNKHDLYDALSVPQVMQQLKLHEVQQKWHIQSTCAIKYSGLTKVLEHLCEALTTLNFGQHTNNAQPFR